LIPTKGVSISGEIRAREGGGGGRWGEKSAPESFCSTNFGVENIAPFQNPLRTHLSNLDFGSIKDSFALYSMPALYRSPRKKRERKVIIKLRTRRRRRRKEIYLGLRRYRTEEGIAFIGFADSPLKKRAPARQTKKYLGVISDFSSNSRHPNFLPPFAVKKRDCGPFLRPNDAIARRVRDTLGNRKTKVSTIEIRDVHGQNCDVKIEN